MKLPNLVFWRFFDAPWLSFSAAATGEISHPLRVIGELLAAAWCIHLVVSRRKLRKRMGPVDSWTPDNFIVYGRAIRSSLGKGWLICGGVALLLGLFVASDRIVFVPAGVVTVCLGALILFASNRPGWKAIRILIWLFFIFVLAIGVKWVWLYMPHGRGLVVPLIAFWIVAWVAFQRRLRKRMGSPATWTPETRKSALGATRSFLGWMYLAIGGIAVVFGAIAPKYKLLALGAVLFTFPFGAYMLHLGKKSNQRS